MSKHFAVIAESVPHTYHGGGGVTVYSALRSMLEHGYRVTVIALNPSPYNGTRSEEDHIQHLKALGASVYMLDSSHAVFQNKNPWKKFFPVLGNLFPGFHQADRVRDVIEGVNPDAVFMYHWDSIAAALLIKTIPKLGIVGDPANLPQLYRKGVQARYEVNFGLKRRIKHHILDHLQTRAQIKAMHVLLNSCDSSGAFAAHHAHMFAEHETIEHLYYRTPTPDPLINGAEKNLSKKFKIMHIGHLRGTATLAGVDLLANSIIPILKERLPSGSFEIHLVGGYFDSLPRALQEKLNEPFVKIRGQVSPADEEFLSSHIVLVPTPIELGIRVRIITALSFGSCVVAHIANKAGIPELIHGNNCLLGENGDTLAHHCLDLFSDSKKLLAIEAESRKTYENFFSLNTAGSEIIKKLRELSNRKHNKLPDE